MGVVYLIENKINRKKYVGKTKYTAEKRWRGHVSTARGGKPTKMTIILAIRKYGYENFSISVLEEVSTNDDELSNAEIKWIAKLGTRNGEIGYNQTMGGEGTAGHVMSEEGKQKLREYHKKENLSPETLKKMSVAAKKRYENGHGKHMRLQRKRGKDHYFYEKNWGRTGPIKEETKRKLSEKHKGKKLSEEHKEAIRKSGEEYWRNHDGPNLGKKWSSETRKKLIFVHHFKKKPIFGYDCKGECIVAYFSTDDAIEVTGLSYRTLLGNRKKYKKKFVDGFTYKRSNMTIKELKEQK